MDVREPVAECWSCWGKASGCPLVDTRESVKHTVDHITGSRLIPLGELEQRTHEISPDQPPVITWRSKKRGKHTREGFPQKTEVLGNIRLAGAGGLRKPSDAPPNLYEQNVEPETHRLQEGSKRPAMNSSTVSESYVGG